MGARTIFESEQVHHDNRRLRISLLLLYKAYKLRVPAIIAHPAHADSVEKSPSIWFGDCSRKPTVLLGVRVTALDARLRDIQGGPFATMLDITQRARHTMQENGLVRLPPAYCHPNYAR
eukprot:4615843-Pyramimonas_sp.AAC.1